MGKIILASSSPRRRFLLEKSNYVFDVIPSPYKEDHTVTEFSYEFIEGLAEGKAKSVISLVKGPAKIIGADTVVVLDKEILEKPKDREDAFHMLQKLSNKTHIVVTAIAVINSETKEYKIESTTSHVTFNELSDELIDFYIDSYKPLDKAGSYGIQELPDGFIKNVEGDMENIIGISSKSFEKLIREMS